MAQEKPEAWLEFVHNNPTRFPLLHILIRFNEGGKTRKPSLTILKAGSFATALSLLASRGFSKKIESPKIISRRELFQNFFSKRNLTRGALGAVSIYSSTGLASKALDHSLNNFGKFINGVRNLDSFRHLPTGVRRSFSSKLKIVHDDGAFDKNAFSARGASKDFARILLLSAGLSYTGRTTRRKFMQKAFGGFWRNYGALCAAYSLPFLVVASNHLSTTLNHSVLVKQADKELKSLHDAMKPRREDRRTEIV